MLDSVLTAARGRGVAISPTQNTVRFGLFELDLRTRQITKNGIRIRLPLQPLQILCVLLERPGGIVTRDELRRSLWPSDVFVDFDHGLNKSIQKLREALGDSAGSPRYIETIPRIGYRFIAPVNEPRRVLEFRADATLPRPQSDSAPSPHPAIAETRRPRWFLLAAWAGAPAICALLVVIGLLLYRSHRRPQELRYTQLTDFTDSAVAPALSPDGRMLAFIRGANGFLTSDQIYVKMLPNGEARRVTDDDRPKYGPAFSPDASEIAYTVLNGSSFSTYEVSVLGGEPHLLLNNAAGLVWLDAQRLLFSEILTGIHMGVVTATVTRAGLHTIYFPEHERGMAHFSFPSPDRRRALVVEMNGSGEWAPCRLVALDGTSPPRSAGPAGPCTAAGWSPDGNWMYFIAWIDGQSHLWRQHFPDGESQQMTFGPTEEEGLAVEPAGRALITAVGVRESALWMHDASGDRPLSSEGEVVAELSPPVFSSDATVLYYLLRRGEDSGVELWRTVADSGKSELVFPGISMTAFALSPDGKQVVYTTDAPGGTTQLWLAPVDRSAPALRIQVAGARAPHFGPHGKILFDHTEGNANYLEQIDPDGSHRSKVFPWPILEFQSVSPGGRWVIAPIPWTQGRSLPAVMAIPFDGGAPRHLCAGYCKATWSADGKFLLVSMEDATRTSPGRSLAIPVGPGESLPDLPAGGLPPLAEPSIVPGARSIARAALVPGNDVDHYAWVNTTVHRNLYRISLP